MDTRTIESAILSAMPSATVEVRGEDGVHFEALVVSEDFVGLRPLARHRLINEALGDLMGGAIHALSLRTLTPEEAWQKS